MTPKHKRRGLNLSEVDLPNCEEFWLFQEWMVGGETPKFARLKSLSIFVSSVGFGGKFP